MPAPSVRLTGVAVAIAYFVAARLGFELAFVAEQVTTVWAPTGIAQAAVLLWGRRLWPAVFIGAFVANASSAAPLWTAALIAGGNTLEAVTAAALLPRGRLDPSLCRLSDAARFIAIAALGATAISATVGITTLCAAGVQPWERYRELWSAWWVGDALGALVIAPIVLTAIRPALPRVHRDRLPAAILLAFTIALSLLVFSDVLTPLFGDGPLHYVLFPIVIVAAVRFGQPTTAAVVFGASVAAIVNTVNGAGPFAAADINRGLILLQTFMGVLAATGLLLAAAITQQRTTQRRLGAAHAVGEVLADATDLKVAAPSILRAVGEGLGWPMGIVWWADPASNQMLMFAEWSERPPEAEPFMSAIRQCSFQRGEGQPGRVWASGRALWVEDLARSSGFTRVAAAEQSGLRSGLAFPIRLGADVAGVIELFTDRVSAPDADLLEAVSTIGNQIGQFIGRKRVEESIRLSEEQLRDAAQRKDEFLAMLAHELRNPLAPIRTGLELMKRTANDPRALEQVRTMMERQVRHMVRLIDDLLDVSRITSGKIHLQRATVRLSELIDGAIEANRSAIDSAAVQLDVDLPDEGVELLADPTRLVQVISNLLHNATKFSHAGGRIAVRARVAPDQWGADALTLTVSDQGIGITGELLPRVFELFTQGERSGAGGGLGIGLALARRIVELHGGSVHARSAGHGAGAEFTVTLPGVRRTGDSHAATPNARPQPRIDRRVLIIDDNADAAAMLALFIRAMGGETAIAHDGESGLRAAAEFAPDVILLDIGMPGVDGYETCRRLRRQMGTGVMIVAVTGWGQERDRAHAREAGFDAHLIKPSDPEALIDLLASPSDNRSAVSGRPPGIPSTS